MDVIIIDKARRAYKQIGGPIIVEDIAAGLVKLNGLPGPFIKYFEAELGADALYKLATKSGDAAIVTCAAAYFDGSSMITVRSEITGIVVSARGSHGFGFDVCFVPDGGTKTFAEMTATDNVAPTISFTNPADGAGVNGTALLSVNTADNVAVTRVVISDGTTVIRDATSQDTYGWGTRWDSSLVKNGHHTLTATAYDAAGNKSTATITVTVKG